MKKLSIQLAILSLIALIGHQQTVFCSQEKRAHVYVTGFNGTNLQKEPFYTKQAVLKLAERLKKEAQNHNSLDIEAVSTSAGTTTVCLHQLRNYNEAYFDGAGITKEDADQINKAVDNGTIILEKPLLDLRKTRIIAKPSNYLSKATIAGTWYTMYRYGIFDRALEMMGYNPTTLNTAASAVTTGLATAYVFGSHLQNAWATTIEHTIVPIVTKGNYNPNDIKPVDALDGLSQAKCPILLQCNEKETDGVLTKQETDVQHIYDSVKKDNKYAQLHITKRTDIWGQGSLHNRASQKYIQEKTKFKNIHQGFLAHEHFNFKQEVTSTEAVNMALRHKHILPKE